MGSKKRHLIYKRKNGSNKKKYVKVYNNRNSGQILEDIVDNRLNKYKKFHTKHNCMYTVAENIEYHIGGVRYEIDNFFIRIYKGKKTLGLFEDKMGDHRGKAYKQLRRHVEYIKNNFDIDKIMCFYVHNYNRRTKKYQVEHVKTLDYRLE